jgi:hypothetical protein
MTESRCLYLALQFECGCVQRALFMLTSEVVQIKSAVAAGAAGRGTLPARRGGPCAGALAWVAPVACDAGGAQR